MTLFYFPTVAPQLDRIGTNVTVPQACLNAPEPATNENGIEGGEGDSPEDPTQHAQVPRGNGGMPPQPQMPPGAGYGMTPEQALQYQSYLQQQQQAGAYPGVPGQGGMPQHR